MKTSPTGLALIQRFEGFSPTPYRCPAGWPTIGYGHLIRSSEKYTVIDKEIAEALLVQDVTMAERSITKLIHVPLTQNQFDALASFTFNLGGAALQRSTLRQVVNRGEHEQVPSELLRWIRAGGQIQRGLVRRRAAEASLYIK